MKEVTIYTVSYCPFCQKAKMFLKDKNVEYDEIICDVDEDIKRQELTEEFNLKSLATFPQIIVNGKHIGGYSDMMEKVEQGELVF